jgi:amino acid adenylation domain-containing protein
LERLATRECETGTVRELVDRMANTQGETTFLLSPETGRVLTFAGFQEQSRAITTRLRRLGLQRGDKVAFMLDNGLFTAQLFLGTMYGGMVSVPLNVRAGMSQLSYTLEHCDAKVVFVERQYAALAREALAGVSRTLEVIPANVDAFATDGSVLSDDTPAEPFGPEDVALLMYTSGSVGQPKAAIHSHRTLLAHGRNSINSHQLTSADRSLLVLPIYHINAECVTLMPTLLSGGSVVVPHHFSVRQFWDWLDEYQCTWSAIVPTIVAQLLDWKDPHAGSRDAAFQRIRFIRSSSAPLSPSMQCEFLDKFKLLLIQAMGSSEAGNVFSNPLPPGENKIGTPGLAWGFETRIIDRDGADVPRGEPGEVLLRGAAIAQGYYKDAEGTAAALDAEGWLHTGDLAYQDHEGYFFVIGRSKELIIKGGMNIAPRQIDDVLESHPAVLEAAAVGVPDHYLGEDLAAFAVLRAGMEADESEMLAFCESRLGHFKTPTRIHFVADLPKGPSGKVQRLKLLDITGQVPASEPRYRNGDSAQAAMSAAEDTVEETIARIWTEVLGQPQVARDSNFFALGGDSLMAIQCLSKLRERLEVVLSASDFFENPTVAQQAAFVRARPRPIHRNGNSALARQSQPAAQQAQTQSSSEAPAGPQPITARGRNLPYPLSSGQQRIWFFKELAPEVPLYNESEAVRLVGELNADAMEQALNLIAARHEVLRTTVQKVAERPLAIVHESWPLRMKRIDLTAMAPAQRAAEVDRLLIDEPRRPYQLETEPGIRVTLVRLGPSEHVFILMLHHLVCDLASFGILWREVSSAYHAILHGEPPALGRLPIQYGDYAVWQQQRIDEGEFAGDLDFWGENLRGAPELLDLPSDRPRQSVQSFRGARHRVRLNPILTETMRNFARQEKTTLFTVFTAALSTLLYRLTGADDVLIGVPLADRDRTELQSVFGFFLHTHVLRTRLHAGETVRELLASMQRSLLELYSHREAPFDQVVTKLRPERSLSHAPLFQVMIIWRDKDQQLPYIGLDGLEVESLLAETRTSKFDLTLLVTDFEQELWLEAEYNTDLFDETTIQRWLNHYVTLLSAMAEDAARTIYTLPLLTEQERERLALKWNDTQADFPATRSVHDLIQEQAVSTPDRVAVECGGNRLTYAELNHKAELLAFYLRRRGARPGVAVGVMVERSLEMLIALLGVMKSGAAYVPIDPSYPAERVSFMLDDARVRFLLTQERLAQSLPVSSREVMVLDRDWNSIVAASAGEGVLPAAAPTAEDLAYVIYTSGSTGQPKGVEITHRSVVNLLCSMRKKPGLTADDTLVAVTTLSFDIAALELFLPLCVGAKLVIASREAASNGTNLLERLIESRATVIQATPITFRMLIEAGWNGKPAMKVLCGGEALPRELANQIVARSTALWNMYGPTETTIWSSTVQIEPGDGPVPIGRPIDNTQFHILDAAGKLTPIGVAGELHIAGVGVARGYLNRPELTSDKFVVNTLDSDRPVRLYKTGDLVRRRADGNIDFLGRLDNQVKLHGFRIELGEIEAELGKHPGVGQCVVTARTNQTGDQRLVAYVAPERELSPSSEQLHNLLREKLPGYMVPAAFVMLEKLPLTPNGKIDRNALPAPELDRSTSEAVYVAPRTPMENALAEIWRKVLGLNQIGLHDDFFALGGHSLQATRLIGEVHKSLNEKLSVTVFFHNPTIEGMARLLEEEEEKRARSEIVSMRSFSYLVPIRPDGSTPPLFLLHGIGGKILGFHELIRYLAPHQRVYGIEYVIDDSEPAVLSLEYLAARYLQSIRKVQAEGPYYLLGYSFGGMLAFEMAQQLYAIGQTVGLLGMVDSHSALMNDAEGQDTPHSLIRAAKRKVQALNFHVRQVLRGRSHYIREEASEKLGNLAARARARIYAILTALGRPIPKFLEDAYAVNWFAASRYKARPCPARVTLFLAASVEGASDERQGYELGWKSLAGGGVEVHEIPGKHHDIIREPNVKLLASELTTCLTLRYEPRLGQTRLLANGKASQGDPNLKKSLDGIGNAPC